jgi:hypothetical protein
MLPFVNSLFDSPGILRDSLGNCRPWTAGPGLARRWRRQNARQMRQKSGLRSATDVDDDWMSRGRTLAMAGVKNGLYTVETEMTDGGRGRASGVIVLVDGRIAGGDAHFYYTGSYTAENGKWRGELTTYQHQKPVGVVPLFGGREVTSGFSGTYSEDGAVVNGMSLVGKTSVLFQTKLKFREAL